MTLAVGRPLIGVLAVVRRGERVLLAQRLRGPYVGRWGFPGGHVEPGETMIAAAMRELGEETGVTAEPRRLLDPFDEIGRDAAGGLLWHYVLAPVLLDWRAGEGEARDDAAAVVWATAADMTAGRFDLLARVEPIARAAFALP